MIIFDRAMTDQQRQTANQVLQELGLQNVPFKILFNVETKSFRYQQDRRVVHVPEALIKEAVWADIRHLFRAILTSPNSLWNTSSPNEWRSGSGHV